MQNRKYELWERKEAFKYVNLRTGHIIGLNSVLAISFWILRMQFLKLVYQGNGITYNLAVCFRVDAVIVVKVVWVCLVQDLGVLFPEAVFLDCMSGVQAEEVEVVLVLTDLVF